MLRDFSAARHLSVLANPSGRRTELRRDLVHRAEARTKACSGRAVEIACLVEDQASLRISHRACREGVEYSLRPFAVRLGVSLKTIPYP